MQVQTKSEDTLKKEEQERREASLHPAGSTVAFEVKTAVERVSKSGNDMFEIDLQTFRPDGTRAHVVRTWIVPDSMMYRLHDFCKAIGIEDAYDAGVIETWNMEGKFGEVVLNVETSDQYGTKNVVKKFVVPSGGVKKPAPPTQNLAADLSDDIPF